MLVFFNKIVDWRISMIELRGKHNICKVFTDNIDNATVGQLIALMNQSSVAGSQTKRRHKIKFLNPKYQL